MNKGVFWGVGLGLLVLAFLGGFWLAGSPLDEPSDMKPAQSALPVPPAPLSAGASGSPGQAGAARLAPRPDALGAQPSLAPSPGPGLGSSQLAAPGAAENTNIAGTPKSKEERRKIVAQIRALSAELQAKGANATMQDVREYLDEVERLGQGQLDTRYFATTRQIIDQTDRALVLNQELARISKSTAPADQARRQAILAELSAITSRINASSAVLQSYSNEAASRATPR